MNLLILNKQMLLILHYLLGLAVLFEERFLEFSHALTEFSVRVTDFFFLKPLKVIFITFSKLYFKVSEAYCCFCFKSYVFVADYQIA